MHNVFFQIPSYIIVTFIESRGQKLPMKKLSNSNNTEYSLNKRSTNINFVIKFIQIIEIRNGNYRWN